MYGHVEKLAEEIKKGAASVEGVEAKLWQVINDFVLFFLSLSFYLKRINYLLLKASFSFFCWAGVGGDGREKENCTQLLIPLFIRILLENTTF